MKVEQQKVSKQNSFDFVKVEQQRLGKKQQQQQQQKTQKNLLDFMKVV